MTRLIFPSLTSLSWKSQTYIGSHKAIYPRSHTANGLGKWLMVLFWPFLLCTEWERRIIQKVWECLLLPPPPPSTADTLNLWRKEGRRRQMEKSASQGWLQPERGLKRHPWAPYFFCHQWLSNQMSPICRSKWDFSYWLPWKLSWLSTNRVMCILHHHQPQPTAGMSELGRCWQICHWCMRPGKIELLLAWQCWPGLSINEEQMQFAKHIELIRGYNKAGLESLC